MFGNYMMDMLPQSHMFSVPGHFGTAERESIPLASCAELEPGDLLGITSVPLRRVPVAELERQGEPNPDCDVTPTIKAIDVEPPPKLLERFDSDQRTSFFRVWDTL